MQQKRRPNILWLMTDEQRTDSLGCYGSPWAHTPNLDRLASQGTLFQNAVTPSPVCVSARTSMLTGLYPCQTGVWHNALELRQPMPNLMQPFHEAGYRTASFGKHHYVGLGTAFSVEAGKTLSQQVHYFGYDAQYDESQYDVVKYPGDRYNWVFGGRFPEDASQRAEAQVIDQALGWLDEQHLSADPFFLRISFNGPHTPVVPPEPFHSIIDPSKIHLPQAADGAPEQRPSWLTELGQAADASLLSSEQIQKMRRYYYGEVAFLDAQFGRLIDWMETQGLLEDTIIVYVSDHGTHLGDYGLVQKQTFYDPVVNVPFLFWYPSEIMGGMEITSPVGVQAMLPTLLQFAGFESPGGHHSPSLAGALISGQEPPVKPVFSELTLESFKPYVQHRGRLVMVRLGDWKLSVCLDPEVHDHALHNLAEDPFERSNLAHEPAHQSTRDELLTLILEHLSTGD